MPYDLFLAVPVHRAPAVVAEAGLLEDGWIPVDPATFETAYPGVYAIGDVAAVGTPKAGVFAEGHAAVAAQHIAARIRGATSPAQYDGRGICYLEFGDDEVAKVDVTFFGDQRSGELIGPVTGAGSREGRVRLEPHQALVRSRLEHGRGRDRLRGGGRRLGRSAWRSRGGEAGTREATGRKPHRSILHSVWVRARRAAIAAVPVSGRRLVPAGVVTSAATAGCATATAACVPGHQARNHELSVCLHRRRGRALAANAVRRLNCLQLSPLRVRFRPPSSARLKRTRRA